MKHLFLVLVLLLIPGSLAAQTLEKAYQREVGYLKSQKRTLETRLADAKKDGERKLATTRSSTNALQSRWLSLQAQTEQLQEQLSDMNANGPSTEDQQDALLGTYDQARQSLEQLGYNVAENEAPSVAEFSKLFSIGVTAVVDGREIKTAEGQFFTANGTAKTGSITRVGRIAAFADGAPLAPAGEGRLKTWTQQPAPGVVLFETVEKALDPPTEKKLADTLKAGGTIGWVIVVLGFFALLLMIARLGMLARFAGSRDFAQTLESKLSNRAAALEFAKNARGLPAEAVAKLLGRDKISIDDVDEVVAGLAPRAERFNTILLVIAAVAPLLGLLGTVTGMIATFDIITEFGTGDPKLLSSGISEALITTKLGLVVAIPTLIVGNVLRAWGDRIISEMDHTSLMSRNVGSSEATVAETDSVTNLQIAPVTRLQPGVA